MQSNECYIAGSVNVGRKERKRRYKNGWFYLVVCLALFLMIYFFKLPRAFGLLIYIPAALSALGFLQAANSFCVYYGLRKEYRLDNESNNVQDEEDIVADKKTSINIIVVALSIALVATFFAYILL
jgi:hypothetical protein